MYADKPEIEQRVITSGTDLIHLTSPDYIFFSNNRNISGDKLLKTALCFANLYSFQKSWHQYIYVRKPILQIRSMKLQVALGIMIIYNFFRGFSPPPPPPPLLLPAFRDCGLLLDLLPFNF